MFRYRLRTLLILLALLPPLLWIGWGKYQAWRTVQEQLVEIEQLDMPSPLKRPAWWPPDSSDLEHGKGR